jgi:hypothetical protein
VGTTPADAARLADMREWAADPGAVCYPVTTNSGRAVIFPEDIAGRTDEQLLTLIRERCSDNK